MGASGAANTAAKRVDGAFLCLVGHKMSTRAGNRCPLVLAAESQQPKDRPDTIDRTPLVGDMETSSAPGDYEGSKSGVVGRGNTAEYDDSSLKEQSAG